MARSVVRLMMAAPVLLAGLAGCATGSANPSSGIQPRGPVAPCPGYQSVQTARLPDGRLLLQAFDSAAPTSAQNPRQVGRTIERGPSAEDTTTNRLLGVQVTSSPYLSSSARQTMAREMLEVHRTYMKEVGTPGSILLIALVDTDGAVRRTRVVSSSGHREMDAAAANVLRRARFEPATAGECRVPYVLRLPVSYYTP